MKGNEKELLARSARPYLKGIARVSKQLVSLGWAEANAGNFSIRTGDGLITKITGAEMRAIAKNPLRYLCFVRPIKGWGYEVLPARATPTKEIFAHILGQRALMRFRPEDKVLLHTHPVKLISLSNQYPRPEQLLEEIFSRFRCRRLLSIITAVEYAPEGSTLLARRTGRALKKARLVIWSKHGVIASGKTLSQALRLIITVNKVAAGKGYEG
ncbi:MAG: class II aldolase/adducin family protein [candidate division WOR-3 bacterium]